MDIRAFYEKIGGDYEDVLSRLGKEERVLKYINKFAESTDMQELCQAIEAEDWELAFRMAHTIKGVAANLGFTDLFSKSAVLCDSLRAGTRPEGDLGSMLEDVQQAWNIIKR